MENCADPHNDKASEAEFVRLLTLYQPNIFLYIRSLVLSPDDAPEILQETNLVLWEKHDRFECGTNFLAWAFKIARYKLKEQRSQNKRKVRCFSDALIDELALQSPQYVDSGNWIDELNRCIAKLVAVDRELITPALLITTDLQNDRRDGRSSGSLGLQCVGSNS